MNCKTLLSAGLLAALADCEGGLGLPFTQHPDPAAAEAVASTEPLVQDCRSRFKTWLGKTPVNWEGGAGPSITRTGESVNIRLEALPTGPEAIDPIEFSCDYDNGQFDTAGPVQ
jgi:hypothetical protein